jgi:hypothetical protein
MISQIPTQAKQSAPGVRLARNVSLSTYFPRNTQYFYGYPAGEDSGFLNQVPPYVEELVAMRAVSCAGSHVSIIGFAATNAPCIDQTLLDMFDVPQINSSQLSLLPERINTTLEGEARNSAIKGALQELTISNSLIMAQPYLSPELSEMYQIPPDITTWLNDKQNLEQLFADALIPKRLGNYPNGIVLAQDASRLDLPCVVKASSSSAGDGVYICKTASDLDSAVAALKAVKVTILVEQYVEVKTNYGIHFGIPYDKDQPIDFIGINEQLTTETGEFIGGLIWSTDFPDELMAIKHYLEYVALPKVRERGWYGVGCFDILADHNGQLYFVDCNFRMTGMSAYHFLVANGNITTPLLGFSGNFYGSRETLESVLLPHAGRHGSSKIMQIIAISQHDNRWSFNAALMFDKPSLMRQRANKLLSLGIESEALQQICS